ncbi:hypothetical protein OIU34_21765 [Pararhizobium sp. BT-229]|uniref:hypothetical protein n=1 Tax=Pararhizobium sp. BT-229 TaxID=2986923 RepID=UPI0021F70090|nr:hypothetical protein [Pararhizobium sp. BT-229]MCV9964521.1 hypothetical protein [Pararhizobium sp. BT-229]
MAKSKTKFTYAQLALAAWLNEDAEKRFCVVATDHYSSKSIALYQIEDGKVVELASPSAGCKDTALVDRLGGNLEIDYTPLVAVNGLETSHCGYKRDDGLPNVFTTFMARIGYDRYKDTHNVRLLRQGRAASKWWQDEGEALFESLKSKRDADRASVARTVIIGSKCCVYAQIDKEREKSFPAGFRHPIPDLTLVRPTWKARVVKETKERLYIQDVVRIRDVDTMCREGHSIRDSAPNQYVDRSNVMIDGAVEAAAARLVAIDEDRIEGYRRACDTALAAALEPLLTLHARLLQAEAMHDDVMREAIDAGTAKD